MNVIEINGVLINIEQTLDKLHFKGKLNIDERWALRVYFNNLKNKNNNLQSKIDKAIEILEDLKCDARFDNCYATMKLDEVQEVLEEDK